MSEGPDADAGPDAAVGPQPFEHYRTREAAYVPGTYRVVGADADTVALLRVTDSDGNRANTGHVERVDRRDFRDHFEPAENPDGRNRARLIARLAVAAVLLGVALDLVGVQHPVVDWLPLVGVVVFLGVSVLGRLGYT